mgnify:CR=1 FL=1
MIQRFDLDKSRILYLPHRGGVLKFESGHRSCPLDFVDYVHFAGLLDEVIIYVLGVDYLNLFHWFENWQLFLRFYYKSTLQIRLFV